MKTSQFSLRVTRPTFQVTRLQHFLAFKTINYKRKRKKEHCILSFALNLGNYRRSPWPCLRTLVRCLPRQHFGAPKMRVPISLWSGSTLGFESQPRMLIPTPPLSSWCPRPVNLYPGREREDGGKPNQSGSAGGRGAWKHPWVAVWAVIMILQAV